MNSQACLTHSVSCEIKTATNSFFNSFLNVHRKKKKNYSEKSIKKTIDLMSEKIFNLEDFLLTEEELIENEFPFENEETTEEEDKYVKTEKHEKQKHKTVSMVKNFLFISYLEGL